MVRQLSLRRKSGILVRVDGWGIVCTDEDTELILRFAPCRLNLLFDWIIGQATGKQGGAESGYTGRARLENGRIK